MRGRFAERLEALEAMSLDDIRTEWERAYKTPAPNLSAELLRLGVAWRISPPTGRRSTSSSASLDAPLSRVTCRQPG